MQEEGEVFDCNRVVRLKRAFELILDGLVVAQNDHDLRKRLARTLVKMARRQPEDASPALLAEVTIRQARMASPLKDYHEPWLDAVRRSSSPPSMPWHLVRRLGSHRLKPTRTRIIGE